jgi:hypothetical protein
VQSATDNVPTVVEEFAMPDNSPTPTVAVDAGNDDSPHKASHTSVGVSGSDFPPGSAVNIKINPGNLRGTADVRADGKFDWSGSVRPQLACHTPVTATVHGSDGIMVTGEDDVFCPGDAS